MDRADIGILSVSISKMELGYQGKRRQGWEGKGKNGSFAFSFHDTPTQTHRRCSCLSSYLSCFSLFFAPCAVSMTMMMMMTMMKEGRMMLSVKRGVMTGRRGWLPERQTDWNGMKVLQKSIHFLIPHACTTWTC